MSARVPLFDWVRVWVTVVVLHHHASLAYTASPYRKWYVLDEHGTIVFDAIVRIIDPFSMPVFFLLAGYLTARSLQPPAGPRPWILGRLQRLGVPFVAGLFVLMPIPMVFKRLDQLGLAEDGLGAYFVHTYLHQDIRAGYLWFLSLLLVIQGIAWVASRAWPTLCRPLEPNARRPAGWSHWLVFVAVVAVSTGLPQRWYGEYEWFEWLGTGVVTVQPTRLGIYGMSFVAGVYGWRHQWAWGDAPWARLRHALPLVLACSVVQVIFSYLWYDRVAESTLFCALNSVLHAMTAGLWMAALLGLGHAATTRWGRPEWLRRLSSATYGMYLLQMVFIVPAQYALKPWSAGPLVKDVVVFGVGLVGAFLLTDVLIRRVPSVGRLLS